jgi:hypothetical protein
MTLSGKSASPRDKKLAERWADAEMIVAWARLFTIAEGMVKSGESSGVLEAFASLVKAMDDGAATARRMRREARDDATG